MTTNNLRQEMRAQQAKRDKDTLIWAQENKVGTKPAWVDLWLTPGTYGCAPAASRKGSCRRRRAGQPPLKQQRKS